MRPARNSGVLRACWGREPSRRAAGLPACTAARRGAGLRQRRPSTAAGQERADAGTALAGAGAGGGLRVATGPQPARAFEIARAGGFLAAWRASEGPGRARSRERDCGPARQTRHGDRGRVGGDDGGSGVPGRSAAGPAASALRTGAMRPPRPAAGEDLVGGGGASAGCAAGHPAGQRAPLDDDDQQRKAGAHGQPAPFREESGGARGTGASSGSSACNSSGSTSLMARSFSPRAVSCKLPGRLSSHCPQCSCNSASVATASRQRCGLERRSCGRRQRTGLTPSRSRARQRRCFSEFVSAILFCRPFPTRIPGTAHGNVTGLRAHPGALDGTLAWKTAGNVGLCDIPVALPSRSSPACAPRSCSTSVQPASRWPTTSQPQRCPLPPASSTIRGQPSQVWTAVPRSAARASGPDALAPLPPVRDSLGSAGGYQQQRGLRCHARPCSGPAKPPDAGRLGPLHCLRSLPAGIFPDSGPFRLGGVRRTGGGGAKP